MSLNRRTVNVPVLIIGMLALAVALTFMVVPSSAPQAIIQVTTSTVASSTVSSTTSSTATSSTQTSTSTSQTSTSTTTTPQCPSDSVWDPVTQKCEAVGPPPPFGAPAWWTPLVIGLFTIVGLALLIKGSGLI